jgi:NAD(P)H-dependent FMN reductase
MTKPKILAFAGSLRKDSYNKKLVQIAIRGAQREGAEVTYIDLCDYPLPVYDGDIEANEGLPENAIKLKKLMWAHDGFLISAPEYNSSITGVLKNTIDWASRNASADEVYLSCFIDKVAALMSASPGGLGGLRGLVHLRAILGNINTLVIPAQKCISNASDVFDANGNLKNAKDQQEIEGLGQKLAITIMKHTQPLTVASSVR